MPQNKACTPIRDNQATWSPALHCTSIPSTPGGVPEIHQLLSLMLNMMTRDFKEAYLDHCSLLCDLLGSVDTYGKVVNSCCLLDYPTDTSISRPH